MADIFLSYVRPDAKRAKQVAEALEARGWSVWWDTAPTPGMRFRDKIAEELHAAGCVVVLWSKQSIASDWVVDEAEDGKHRGVLVQALIEDVRPPPGFQQIQAAMLMGWDGRDSGEFARLCEGVAAYAPLADSSEHPSSTYSGQQATVVEEFPLLKRLIASPINAASSTDSRRATPEQWRDLEQRFRDLKGTTLQAVLLMHPEREGSAWIINGGSKESRRDFQVLAALADSLLRKSLRTWAKIDSTDVRDSLAPSHRWLYFVKWKGAKTDRTFAGKFREIANVAKASAGACAECAAYESIL